jgi:NADH-quinone oxidoreductase subunit M
VVLASVYMLRAFIRTMHNRPPERAESRELSPADGLVIVPLVLLVLVLAFYPQAPLARSEESVESSVRTARLIADPPPRREAQTPPSTPPPGAVPQQP